MDSSIYILDISQNDMDAPNFSLLGRLDLLNIGENSKGATDILTAHMAVSSDDQWLAIATHNHQVLIFHLDSLRLYAKLPLYDYPVTCLSFHPQNSTLAIALTSNQFYLYDVEKAAYEDWTREYLNRLPSRLLNRKEIIMGCCFNASKPNGLILWGSTYFCNVDLQKSVGSSDLLISESKRKKVEGTEENSSKSCKNSKNDGFSESFKMDHRYGPLMFLDCIGNEIVIVERPALSIMKNLPLSYYKHAYGT
jgi:U3 small nucleolar RNA-associated protein 4